MPKFSFVFDSHRRSGVGPILLRPLLPLLLFVGLAAGRAQEDPVNVVTTVAMIADVVTRVGADEVEVVPLMGPGTDPHLYRASASDVRAMQRADLILYSGYSLEGQFGEVLDRFGQQKPVVAVSPAAIPLAELISVQDIYGIDPHVWMDVSLWQRTADVVAEALTSLRPEASAAFATRSEQLKTELQSLHAWVIEAVASIPQDQRILVTAHDAFAYYGRAYGIEVAGIQGISTEAEAGIADIRGTIDLVVERKVPAVFVESTINPRTVEAVIEAAAERGQTVTIGGELFSDAMGDPETAAGTYIGMIYQNTVNIVSALGGVVPPLPEELSAWAERWDISP